MTIVNGSTTKLVMTPAPLVMIIHLHEVYFMSLPVIIRQISFNCWVKSGESRIETLPSLFLEQAFLVLWHIKLGSILNYLQLHVWWLPQISSKLILDNEHSPRFLRMSTTLTRCSHKRPASLHRKSCWNIFLYHWACLIPQYFQLVVDLASVAFQKL